MQLMSRRSRMAPRISFVSRRSPSPQRESHVIRLVRFWLGRNRGSDIPAEYRLHSEASTPKSVSFQVWHGHQRVQGKSHLGYQARVVSIPDMRSCCASRVWTIHTRVEAVDNEVRLMSQRRVSAGGTKP